MFVVYSIAKIQKIIMSYQMIKFAVTSCKKYIFDRLEPKNILPDLQIHDIITHDQFEELSNKVIILDNNLSGLFLKNSKE